VTVGELLAAAGLPVPEARALLAPVLGVQRESLIAYPERRVAPAAQARFEQEAARRRAGEPLAYLLGVREFYGREFEVGPAVLIPRPETELLVDLALAVIPASSLPRRQNASDFHQRHGVAVGAAAAAPTVLDLGTGSGCLAITLALERPNARITAVEVSLAALALARANAQRLGAAVEFVEGNWYAPVTGRGFDAIVANPPYVASDDPHLAQGDLRYEPALALTDGADGLACLRRVLDGAAPHLVAGGWLGVEHGCDQGSAVRELFSAASFQCVTTVRDAAGLERVTHGRRASLHTPV
jgi:release factor glutamine methyltransferase